MFKRIMTNFLTLGVIALLLIFSSRAHPEQPSALDSLQRSIIGHVSSLEGASEPKCYATASRLEDFIYGTPLSDDARFRKSELQKELAYRVWQLSGQVASSQGAQEIQSEHLQPVLDQYLLVTVNETGDLSVTAKDDQIYILKDDKRQYSSIAYSLRAILAAQQEAFLINPQAQPVPLSDEAIQMLKDFLDIYTLTALQFADKNARLQDQYAIDTPGFEQAWSLFGAASDPNVNLASRPSGQDLSTGLHSDFRLTKSLIEQKVQSYKAYNHISNPVFLRNLQVYFARMPWKPTPQEAKEFKDYFTAAMVNFSRGLYLGAQAVALENKRPAIREKDVNFFSKRFIPHEINQYEDAIFFPRLSHEEKIMIESYDMDAFRDSGVHWRYLQYAIEDSDFQGLIEPDPFAAELLVENIAQFGVLLLRVAGMEAKSLGAGYLHTQHLEDALHTIQARIDKHAAVPSVTPPKLVIESSQALLASDTSQTYFMNVTQAVGIEFMHRSSDWLSRLIRSYAKKSEYVGELTIPPAFGGSGVAAEDLNNDGWTDILLLGGLGNKVYLNDHKGGFIDRTASSGIAWTRPDNQPGEPRQPIIADLNNDGLQDIIIIYVDDSHRVYKNIGDGRFADVTERAQLGGKGLVAGPATALDINKDGLLDLYIGYFGNYLRGILPTLKRRNVNGLPNQLFLNKGEFQFENITPGSGVDHSGWTQAVGHSDFDNDGWQDIIAGNDFGVNAYYRNSGNNTFVNVADQLGTGKPSYTMNIGIADLNDDLFPDFYISNIVTINKDETYIAPNEDTVMRFNPDKLSRMQVVEANDLFLSDPSSKGLPRYYLSDAVGRGYSSTGWAWDADFFDFDNDGDEDVYVLNGMNEYALYSSESPYYTDPLTNKEKNVFIPVHELETNVFFVNENGKLQNASQESGVNMLSNSRSAAYLDYDRDGDLDIVVNSLHGPAYFYQNTSDTWSGNWMKIRLIGDTRQQSTRDAIGARIIVTTQDGNQSWREIHSTIGYLSVHPKEQHIGIGVNKEADVIVIWPNGTPSEFTRVKANQHYRIDQESGKILTGN